MDFNTRCFHAPEQGTFCDEAASAVATIELVEGVIGKLSEGGVAQFHKLLTHVGAFKALSDDGQKKGLLRQLGDLITRLFDWPHMSAMNDKLQDPSGALEHKDQISMISDFQTTFVSLGQELNLETFGAAVYQLCASCTVASLPGKKTMVAMEAIFAKEGGQLTHKLDAARKLAKGYTRWIEFVALFMWMKKRPAELMSSSTPDQLVNKLVAKILADTKEFSNQIAVATKFAKEVAETKTTLSFEETGEDFLGFLEEFNSRRKPSLQERELVRLLIILEGSYQLPPFLHGLLVGLQKGLHNTAAQDQANSHERELVRLAQRTEDMMSLRGKTMCPSCVTVLNTKQMSLVKGLFADKLLADRLRRNKLYGILDICFSLADLKIYVSHEIYVVGLLHKNLETGTTRDFTEADLFFKRGDNAAVQWFANKAWLEKNWPELKHNIGSIVRFQESLQKIFSKLNSCAEGSERDIAIELEKLHRTPLLKGKNTGLFQCVLNTKTPPVIPTIVPFVESVSATENQSTEKLHTNIEKHFKDVEQARSEAAAKKGMRKTVSSMASVVLRNFPEQAQFLKDLPPAAAKDPEHLGCATACIDQFCFAAGCRIDPGLMNKARTGVLVTFTDLIHGVYHCCDKRENLAWCAEYLKGPGADESDVAEAMDLFWNHYKRPDMIASIIAWQTINCDREESVTPVVSQVSLVSAVTDYMQCPSVFYKEEECVAAAASVSETRLSKTNWLFSQLKRVPEEETLGMSPEEADRNIFEKVVGPVLDNLSGGAGTLDDFKVEEAIKLATGVLSDLEAADLLLQNKMDLPKVLKAMARKRLTKLVRDIGMQAVNSLSDKLEGNPTFQEEVMLAVVVLMLPQASAPHCSPALLPLVRFTGKLPELTEAARRKQAEKRASEPGLNERLVALGKEKSRLHGTKKRLSKQTTSKNVLRKITANEADLTRVYEEIAAIGVELNELNHEAWAGRKARDSKLDDVKAFCAKTMNRINQLAKHQCLSASDLDESAVIADLLEVVEEAKKKTLAMNKILEIFAGLVEARQQLETDVLLDIKATFLKDGQLMPCEESIKRIQYAEFQTWCKAEDKAAEVAEIEAEAKAEAEAAAKAEAEATIICEIHERRVAEEAERQAAAMETLTPRLFKRVTAFKMVNGCAEVSQTRMGDTWFLGGLSGKALTWNLFCQLVELVEELGIVTEGDLLIPTRCAYFFFNGELSGEEGFAPLTKLVEALSKAGMLEEIHCKTWTTLEALLAAAEKIIQKKGATEAASKKGCWGPKATPATATPLPKAARPEAAETIHASADELLPGAKAALQKKLTGLEDLGLVGDIKEARTRLSGIVAELTALQRARSKAEEKLVDAEAFAGSASVQRVVREKALREAYANSDLPRYACWPTSCEKFAPFSKLTEGFNTHLNESEWEVKAAERKVLELEAAIRRLVDEKRKLEAKLKELPEMFAAETAARLEKHTAHESKAKPKSGVIAPRSKRKGKTNDEILWEVELEIDGIGREIKAAQINLAQVTKALGTEALETEDFDETEETELLSVEDLIKLIRGAKKMSMRSRVKQLLKIEPLIKVRKAAWEAFVACVAMTEFECHVKQLEDCNEVIVHQTAVVHLATSDIKALEARTPEMIFAGVTEACKHVCEDLNKAIRRYATLAVEAGEVASVEKILEYVQPPAANKTTGRKRGGKRKQQQIPQPIYLVGKIKAAIRELMAAVEKLGSTPEIMVIVDLLAQLL